MSGDASQGRQGKFTPGREKKILEHLSAGGTYAGAAGAAGISERTLRTWRSEMPEFAERCEQAELAAISTAEAELSRAVREGDRNSLHFWLRSRAGYSFTEKREITGTLETRRSDRELAISEEIGKLPIEQRRVLIASYLSGVDLGEAGADVHHNGDRSAGSA